MAEPASPSVGIVAVAVALLGPMAGEYAVIVLAALAGSLWALARADTPTRTHGALLVMRLVLTAIVLTGGVAWWLEASYEWPVHQMLAPVAFAIGALGERWQMAIEKGWERISGVIGGRT